MTEPLAPYHAPGLSRGEGSPADVALLLAEFRAALPLVMTVPALAYWLERFERAGVEVMLYSAPGGGLVSRKAGLTLGYREMEAKEPQ